MTTALSRLSTYLPSDHHFKLTWLLVYNPCFSSALPYPGSYLSTRCLLTTMVLCTLRFRHCPRVDLSTHRNTLRTSSSTTTQQINSNLNRKRRTTEAWVDNYRLRDMLITVVRGTEVPLELTRQLKGSGLSRGTTYAPLSTASALEVEQQWSNQSYIVCPAGGDLEARFCLNLNRFLLHHRYDIPTTREASEHSTRGKQTIPRS